MSEPAHIPDQCRYVAVNPEDHHLSIAERTSPDTGSRRSADKGALRRHQPG